MLLHGLPYSKTVVSSRFIFMNRSEETGTFYSDTTYYPEWFASRSTSFNAGPVVESGVLRTALKESPSRSSSVVLSGLSVISLVPAVKFRGLFKFLVWRGSLPFFRGGRSSMPFYFDFLKAQMEKMMNLFFPWYETSLQSHFFVTQLQRISNKGVQYQWVSLYFAMLKYFINISENSSFVNFKYFGCYRYRIILRGRYCNMIACRYHRVHSSECGVPRYKFLNNKGYYYSAYSDSFITKWGTASVLFAFSISKGF